MGVALALRKLDKLIEEAASTPIYTLGPIIHNPQVLEVYKKRGVRRITSLDAILTGSRVVIRAHGIPWKVEESLAQRGIQLVDATCPKVKRAQLLIGRQSSLGQRLLLLGESDHPEVKGLRSYARDDAVVFDSLEGLKATKLDPGRGHFFAAQTTQSRAVFEAVVEYLKEYLGADLPVFETICDATIERQAEVVEIAHKVEGIIVAGGRESGNTRRLALVAEAQGVYCLHVETATDLPLAELAGLKTVGLTAGASTPKHIIDEIEARLLETGSLNASDPSITQHITLGEIL
ncbi:4-hydroxy-3-methylbut-2-enyl diphosphate reductase [Desulfovibrionales bacterium]